MGAAGQTARVSLKWLVHINKESFSLFVAYLCNIHTVYHCLYCLVCTGTYNYTFQELPEMHYLLM